MPSADRFLEGADKTLPPQDATPRDQRRTEKSKPPTARYGGPPVLGIFLAAVPGMTSLGLLTSEGGTFFPYWSPAGVPVSEVPSGVVSSGFGSAELSPPSPS